MRCFDLNELETYVVHLDQFGQVTVDVTVFHHFHGLGLQCEVFVA